MCVARGGGGVLTFRSVRCSYKVGDAAGTQPSNKQAASAFLEQYFKPTDLQEFYRLFFGAMSGKTIKVVGDPIGSNAGVEASLGASALATCSMTIGLHLANPQRLGGGVARRGAYHCTRQAAASAAARPTLAALCVGE